MPKLTINGVTTDVEQGKRLVLAIEDADENQHGSALDWVLERITATSSNEEILSGLSVPGRSPAS